MFYVSHVIKVRKPPPEARSKKYAGEYHVEIHSYDAILWQEKRMNYATKHDIPNFFIPC